MKKRDAVISMCISALLCALGIIIPMFMPKIWIPPMSFTLASHVPIFIAMFLSPASALLVTVVTSIGFALSMPLVVALRAASHLVFVVVGSLLLKRVPYLLSSLRTALPFNLLLGVLHGACESLVVTAFYFTGAGSESWYESVYVVTVLLLVGLGTVVHSMVDFTIAAAVWKPLSRMIPIPVSAKWRSASKAAAN